MPNTISEIIYISKSLCIDPVSKVFPRWDQLPSLNKTKLVSWKTKRKQELLSSLIKEIVMCKCYLANYVTLAICSEANLFAVDVIGCSKKTRNKCYNIIKRAYILKRSYIREVLENNMNQNFVFMLAKSELLLFKYSSGNVILH